MKALLKSTFRSLLNIPALAWRPYSRLILVGDNAGWSLDWDMVALRNICRRLGVRTVSQLWRYASRPQAIFYADQFFLLSDNWLDLPHRIGFSYFHGLPGSGDRLLDGVYAGLARRHDRISRVQVTHTQMKNVILETGIAPEKVFLIPIGINLAMFPLRDAAVRLAARKRLNIPEQAFVIGSFQKDGVGWGAGSEPKLIKGPDVFLSVIKGLKSTIPEVYVLLSGPARGYVKAGLEAMQVPFTHVYLKDYPEISRLYQALDLYIVTSRQEGGPKAILESMATGVPVISTEVGQATDLVVTGQNGWLAKVDDAEALLHWARQVHGMSSELLSNVIACGRTTAEANSYDSQTALWAEFMKGYVE